MIQSTVDRLEGLCPPERMLILTNQSLVEPIAAQLPDIPRQSIIGEPAKRDTAPCIGLAASLIVAEDADATMVVMPADHVIQPSGTFQQAIQSAVQLVEQDPKRIVTFGIKPTYPAEIFGYIQRGSDEVIGTRFPTFPVLRFREKPNARTAAEFIAAGTFYWNSGIFVWKASTILDALEQFVPDIAAPIKIIAAHIGRPDYDEVLQREFTAIQGVSIDFAVMERYDNVLVIQSPFEWDDLGNWTALPRLLGQDENGNTIDAKHLGINTENTIIKSVDDHLIVTVGMKDCIVVHMPDATLIADRNHEGEIKQIVKQLEQNKWDQYL
jgi:mannose-1-phosphate guanylyltransferase